MYVTVSTRVRRDCGCSFGMNDEIVTCESIVSQAIVRLLGKWAGDRWPARAGRLSSLTDGIVVYDDILTEGASCSGGTA